MITQVIYSSKSLFARGNGSDQDILDIARDRNARMGVTGFLFRTNSFFVQLVEGPQRQVSALMQDIRADVRHTDVVEWPWTITKHRAFPDWSMGYGDTLGDDNFAYATRVTHRAPTIAEVRNHLVQLAAPYLVHTPKA